MLVFMRMGAGAAHPARSSLRFPFDVARRGLAVGTAVHEAVLLAQRPTATVPVAMSDVLTVKVCDDVIGKNSFARRPRLGSRSTRSFPTACEQ